MILVERGDALPGDMFYQFDFSDGTGVRLAKAWYDRTFKGDYAALNSYLVFGCFEERAPRYICIVIGADEHNIFLLDSISESVLITSKENDIAFLIETRT